MKIYYSTFDLDSFKKLFCSFDFKNDCIYNIRMVDTTGNLITYFPFSLSTDINKDYVLEYIFNEIILDLKGWDMIQEEFNSFNNYFYVHVYVKRTEEALNKENKLSEFRNFALLGLKDGKVIEE